MISDITTAPNPHRGMSLRAKPDQPARITGMDSFGHTIWSQVLAVGTDPNSQLVHVVGQWWELDGIRMVEYVVKVEHTEKLRHRCPAVASGIAAQLCGMSEGGYDGR